MKMKHDAIIKKAQSVVRLKFRLDYQDGIHAIPHWTRVWYHGRCIAISLDANPAILAWFAFLHDSQRHNDHQDPLHGRRAADFAVMLRKDSTIVELSSTEFEQLCEAMRLHSDGLIEGEASIRACWDADRLDLALVGIEPEISRLCTPYARKRKKVAVASRMAVWQRRIMTG